MCDWIRYGIVGRLITEHPRWRAPLAVAGGVLAAAALAAFEWWLEREASIAGSVAVGTGVWVALMYFGRRLTE